MGACDKAPVASMGKRQFPHCSVDDIGNAAVYLLSGLGSAVTGEVHHVDCGYHTVGMLAVDEAKSISDLLNDFDNNK